MNKLQKTLISFVNDYDLVETDEQVAVLENTDRLIAYAETIKVTLCQEEAELISNAGLEMISGFRNGSGEWDLYRKEALKQLDIDGIN